MLFLSDLSYVDIHPFHDNMKWDTFGKFIEKSSTDDPWIYVAGNHELDLPPEIVVIAPPDTNKQGGSKVADSLWVTDPDGSWVSDVYLVVLSAVADAVRADGVSSQNWSLLRAS
ncbi:purple acid phosphatase 5 [Tanacetum coccineum]